MPYTVSARNDSARQRVAQCLSEAYEIPDRIAEDIAAHLPGRAAKVLGTALAAMVGHHRRLADKLYTLGHYGPWSKDWTGSYEKRQWGNENTPLESAP